MKKLLTAVVLTLSTAVAAQQANQDPKQDQNTQAQQEQQRNEGRRIRTGLDATEVGPGLRGGVGRNTGKEGTFERGKSFSVRGTLKKKGATRGEITLARQGLPDAGLNVRKQTQVTLDGKRVEVGAIPEGAQVRARFQLEGDEPVAVTVNATSPKGTQHGTKSSPGAHQGTRNTQPDTQR